MALPLIFSFRMSSFSASIACPGFKTESLARYAFLAPVNLLVDVWAPLRYEMPWLVMLLPGKANPLLLIMDSFLRLFVRNDLCFCFSTVVDGSIYCLTFMLLSIVMLREFGPANDIDVYSFLISREPSLLCMSDYFVVKRLR